MGFQYEEVARLKEKESQEEMWNEALNIAFDFNNTTEGILKDLSASFTITRK